MRELTYIRRVAGSHSTSGTLAFLFWHILHNEHILNKVVQEIDECLGPLQHTQVAYSINGLESRLKYTMACVRENFRMNPVFSMNLWRRVLPAEAQIGDYSIPHGVRSISTQSVKTYSIHD